MEYLNELRKINDNLLNSTHDKKYELIADILKDDDCFYKMDLDVINKILKTLGIADTKKYYSEIMNSKEIYEKSITVVD